MGDANARMLLPPPGIHPNNAVFSSVLPKPLTWQRREHVVQRRNILARIGRLLEHNSQADLSSLEAEMDMSNMRSKTWALARKLEVLMFINSASLMEYSNVKSLARRVQALTTAIVNKQIRKKMGPQLTGGCSSSLSTSYSAQLCQQMSHGQAVQPPHIAPIGFLTHKRSADEMQMYPDEGRASKKFRRFTELGALLFRGYDDLSKVIWSFVDGVQIMRCRVVSRSARALAPLFVISLQLSCNIIQTALAIRPGMGKFSILCDCVNLRQLEVVSLSSGMSFGKLSMRAMNCPQRFVVTHADHEEIVTSLSEQLRFGGFPRLTRLGLTCLFTNEEANGEADVLLNNLMLGCSPDLEELCLPGNSFGDYGACKVAELLRSGVCPNLTRLDLRKNFIGEYGVRYVCEALAQGYVPNLVELCLGGNTITDSSFHHVLRALESGNLSKLRFLGIEMNYLTASSMQVLGTTIGRLSCPFLSQISYSENSISDADAKRVIATAVYQERVRNARRAQKGPYDGGEDSDEE